MGMLKKVRVLSWRGDNPQVCHEYLLGGDRQPLSWPAGPKLTVEVAVVGGGLSGLAAAFELRDRDLLVLEAADQPGGVCLPGSFRGVPYPAGSAYFYLDIADGECCARYQQWGLEVAEAVVAPPTSAMFYQGHWFPEGFTPEGIKALPFDPAVKDRLRRFQERLTQLEESWEPLATPFLSRPEWDRYTLKHYLENIERLPPEVTEWLRPYCRSCLGAGPEVISAWAGIYFLLPEFSPTPRMGFFPEGNARLVRALASSLEGRLKLRQTVLGLRVEPEGVKLLVWDGDSGEPWLLQAEMVILALGKFALRRLLPPDCGWTPELFDAFHYSSYVVAALCGPISLEAPGLENWVVGEEAFSDIILCPRQPQATREDRVMVVYAPQPYPQGRLPLLRRTPEQQAEEILAAVERHFPGVAEEVEEIHLYRFGHAQVVPTPGLIHFLKGRLSPQEGRLILANSDMEGLPCVEAALAQGRKAAQRLRRTLRL